MANYNFLIPKIKYWEGGYVNDPDDTGGCTLSGITIGTYRMAFGNDKNCNDLKNMTPSQWAYVFKKYFWDACKGDEINNQYIAELLVDFAWMSGVKTAVRKIQLILDVDVDGIMGPKTIKAINRAKPRLLFFSLWVSRYNYFYQIVSKRPAAKKYLSGWINRLSSYWYE